MPNKIYLIRHGETDYNKDRRIQGWLDIPLNEAGHEQAKVAANKLRGHMINAIYSSDLSRAAETASHIAAVVGVEIKYTQALRERDMGVFADWAWETEHDPIKDKLWEEFEAARDAEDLDWDKHQGESLRAMTDRIVNFLLEIEKSHNSQSVALVSHGGTVNRILEHLQVKKSQEGFRMIRNASVIILSRKDDSYELEEI